MRNFSKEVDIINTRGFTVQRVRVTSRRGKVYLHEMPKFTSRKRGGVGDEEKPVRGGIGDNREKGGCRRRG